MQPVLDALNHLQSPAFIINKPVFAFVKELGFSKRHPVREDFKTERDFEWAIAEWKTLAESWHLDMVIADYLLALGHFYIPLALDFRGRVNPIPYFHYQRDDHIRGLFLFRDGEQIHSCDDGLAIARLVAYAAATADGNQWSGNEHPSRLRPKERHDWSDANLNTIRRIGDGVLSGAGVGELRPLLEGIDDRCQFVATCCEIAQALNQTDFTTRLPILMDMSNSALQHWGTSVRAPETKFANVGTNRQPEDHYTEVARDVYKTGENCTRLMKGESDRAIVKGAIVAHSYGSRPGWIKAKWVRRNDKWIKTLKATGMTKGIIKTLKKRGPLPTGVTKDAPKLASLILHADNKRTPFVQGAKRFINAITRRYANALKDWRWITLLGLQGINIYRTPETKSVRYFDFYQNKWRKKKIAVGDTDEIERKGAIRAAGANFIHSQDGVGGHLGMIALEARKEKIPLMSIHDGYGTLATRALSLLCIARDTFAKKYESEVSLYADILERARSDLPKNVKLPRLPKRGDLELSDVPLSHNMCK